MGIFPKFSRFFFSDASPNQNSPCQKCVICPFVKEGKAVSSTSNDCGVDINTSLNCGSTNKIYLLGCNRCPQQYIGETERTLKERFAEHRGYVKNKILTKSTGKHFNEVGHRESDMTITILEKIFNANPQYRKQREKMWINKFNTKYKCLNRMNGG